MDPSPQMRAGALVVALAASLLAGCGGGSPATSTVSITHDIAAVPFVAGQQAHYATFTGHDASGKLIYGPVRQAYAAQHLLADVPENVVTVQVAHQHAAGTHVASAVVALPGVAQRSAPVRALASPPPNSIRVELVNDTGNTGGDASMYVLFDSPKVAAPGAVSGIPFLSESGSATANGKSFALSSLTASGTVTSPHTGRALPLYVFHVANVDSGRLSFSYGAPLEIVNGAAPTADTPVRYDKMEVTFKPDDKTGVYSGGGNLTAIDFHAIPLQVEVTHAGETQPDPLQTKSFYASMPTLLNALLAAGKTRNIDMSGALRGTDGKTFTFTATTTDFSTFARLMSPNTLAAANGSNGSPAPYPSFKTYLNALVGKSVQVTGTQYGGSRFTASFGTDGTGGFVITCVGSANTLQITTQAAPVPVLPGPGVTTTVTVNLPRDQLDFFIYATVANAQSYRIAGYEFKDGPVDPQTQKPRYVAQDMVKQANASIYGALVGDLQAALNFGYLGGRFDASTFVPSATQDISAYYASVMLPYAYPFGGARYTNDGFYNPYAALFNALSDAYGHPYSDRLAAASPLYTLKAGDTVRITLLNDNRLDTPLVSVSASADNALTVTWPTVPGATGYSVTTHPRGTVAPCAQGPVASGGVQTCAISGLNSGTAYRIAVTATGVGAAGVPIASASLPVQGVTTGALTLPAAGPYYFEMAVNLPDAPAIPGMQAFVGGQLAGVGKNANFSLGYGQHIIPLQIKSAAGVVVYATHYDITLAQPPGTATQDMFDVGPLSIDYGLTPLSVAAAASPPYPKVGNGLVIGTPFGPKPYYRYFPVAFPQTAP